MPPRGVRKGTKRARQYEHIKESLRDQGKSEDTAEEIAARTVNKERARSGEARSASKLSKEDISSGRRGGLRSGRKGPARSHPRPVVRGGTRPQHPRPVEDDQGRARGSARTASLTPVLLVDGSPRHATGGRGRPWPPLRNVPASSRSSYRPRYLSPGPKRANPLMERNDVDALLRAYHRNGDLAARDQALLELMPLVRALANRYAGRGEPLEDLVQVGSLGLIKAVDRFDVDRGVEFSSYAVPTIVGEIRRHFRDKAWAMHVPRRLKELSVRLSRVLDELTNELGRSPTIAGARKGDRSRRGRGHRRARLRARIFDPVAQCDVRGGRRRHARREARGGGHGLRGDRGGIPHLRGSRRARRARAADRRAPILRRAHAVADRCRGRNLPDARVEAPAPRAGRHARENRGDGAAP